MLRAQDIHFTQYYFSPLNTNAAHTGAFDGDWRIVGNHRSQWGTIIEDQFITSGVSFDQNLDIYNHKIAVGASLVHDRSSVAALIQNKLMLSCSYSKTLKGHELRGGVQFGLLHKGIDLTQFTFPNQFNMDNGDFDNSISNMQNYDKINIHRFDISAGLSWSKWINKKTKPLVGFSLFHINTPKESFLNNESNSFLIRKVMDIKIYYLLSDKITVIPTLLLMLQNKAQEIVWGSIIRHKVLPNKHQLLDVFGGFSSRNGFNRNYDAFTLLCGGTIREYQLGISYDINVSELSSVSHYKGALELSLIYTAKNTKSNILNVPCDRL